MKTKSRALENLVAAVVVAISAAATLHAQVGPEMNSVREANGLTVTGPASGQYFRMRITGSDVERLKTTKKYWFRSDGIRFQFFSEENSSFLMTNLPRRLDDRVVLQLYRSAFIRRNEDVKIRSSQVKLASGKIALFWSYDISIATPGGPNESVRAMFLVVAGPGHVFGLFANVPPGGTERETRRLLTRTLGTLVFSDSE